MAKDNFTDAQVNAEIDRLLDSPLVKLAKKDQLIRNRKRQYMYSLRWLERQGKKLADMGVTIEALEEEDRRMRESADGEDEFCDE